MALSPGDSVWIPCDVTSGVFPDERQVSIESEGVHWVGYVGVAQLREAITGGRTSVRGTVVEASAREISARLPGQTSRRQYLKISADLL